MKSIQGSGPYRLLGYSNGGVVAFEMARQLLQQGDAIESLTLLDSLCPTLRHDPIEVMMTAVFKHFVRTLGGVSDLDVKRLQQVPAHECSSYLYENLERRRPIAQTFLPADSAANLRAQERMTALASGRRLVVPGHDPAVFARFPAPGGRVARIADR